MFTNSKCLFWFVSKFFLDPKINSCLIPNFNGLYAWYILRAHYAPEDEEFKHDVYNHVHNPKPCPICSKVVKNMRKHNLTTHTDNSMLKVKCETCGRGFKDTPSMKSHEMSLHIKTRPFKCRYKCPNDKCDTCPNAKCDEEMKVCKECAIIGQSWLKTNSTII